MLAIGKAWDVRKGLFLRQFTLHSKVSGGSRSRYRLVAMVVFTQGDESRRKRGFVAMFFLEEVFTNQ